MRRHVNIKLVACVLGTLLVLAIGVHFLHGFQGQRNAYRLLERADRALEAKDDVRAMTYYAQYLAFVPNDVDTVQKYAQVLDRHVESYSDQVRLILLLEQVLRVKPNEHELRLRLVHNLIALDRYGEAIDNLKKLEKHSGDKAEVLHMIGWCQDAKTDYAQAARSFEEAIKLKPTQIKSYALLAEVWQDRLNQPDDARQVLDELVRANADSYQAYLLRARFTRRRGDEKGAESDLQTAYKLAPDKPEVIFEVADAARARGNWAEATRLLQDGVKRFPDQVDFYRAMANVNILSNRGADAVGSVQAGLKRAPKSIELNILLIDLLIDQKQYKEARSRIDDLDKLGLKPALPNYLKARLAVAHRDWSEAIRLLESVQKDLGEGSDWNSRVYVLLGVSYRHRGAAEKELDAMRRAVRAEPTWLTANIELGAALLNNGRMEEASQTLEPLKTVKDLPASYWTLLSRARLQGQLRLPEAERRWAEVEEALDRADQAEPLGGDPSAIRAEMLAARRDYDGAKSMLEKAVVRDPQYARLFLKQASQAGAQPRDYRDVLWLARIADAAGEHAEAEKLLRKCLDDAGYAPDTWIAWMEHLQQTKQSERGISDLERLKKELPPARQPLTIARCYEALHLADQAAKAYEAALRQAPDDFIALAFAGDFYRRAGRTDDARRCYERLLDPAIGAPAEYAVPARRYLAELLRAKEP